MTIFLPEAPDAAALEAPLLEAVLLAVAEDEAPPLHAARLSIIAAASAIARNFFIFKTPLFYNLPRWDGTR
jgi:hypothetical protein